MLINQELLTTIESEFTYQVRYSDPINIHKRNISGMENWDISYVAVTIKSEIVIYPTYTFLSWNNCIIFSDQACMQRSNGVVVFFFFYFSPSPQSHQIGPPSIIMLSFLNAIKKGITATYPWILTLEAKRKSQCITKQQFFIQHWYLTMIRKGIVAVFFWSWLFFEN